MTIDEQIAALLAEVDEPVRDLAHRARALVRSVAPQAREEVYPGWGGYLLFKVGDVTVGWVSAHRRHVSLGFSQGAELPDPGRILEGKGKNQRHVKLKSPSDLERPALRALVEAAWAAQPEPAALAGYLERVRQICLALPETRETVAHGHPTFWAGKKTFAVFGLYSPSVAFKAGMDLHEALEGDPRIFPTPYMAHNGWLSLRLDGTTDWDEARDLLEHSYRQVATAKLRAALDAAD